MLPLPPIMRSASGTALSWSRPRRFIGLALATVIALLPLSVRAQAPSLTWEKVGGGRTIDALAFDDEGTLWGASHDLLKLPPGTTEWIEVNDRLALDVIVTAEGYVVISVNGILRSADGGETFESVHTDGGPLHRVREGPRAGLLLSGTGGPGGAGGEPGAAYSTDGGATWTSVEIDPENAFGNAIAFEAVTEGPHAGRVVAGAYNGLAYSDDGGATWELSNLWEPFRYKGSSFARTASGILLAGAEDYAAPFGGVYTSDNGAMWIPGHDFGRLPVFVRALGAGSGPGGSERLVVVDGQGAVWLSDDEGQTWVQTDSVYTEENAVMNDVEVGPDKRLYAVINRPGPVGEDDGLYRTVSPVTVASEEAPVAGEAFVLGVPYPNPSQGAAVVPLVLTGAAEVNVSVYDVLGRRVAMLAEGRFEAGSHRLALDTSALPAGVYVVQAAVGDARAFSQRLTVIR